MAPLIEEWWPHLTIEARHAVLEDPRARLPRIALDEIEALTGSRPDDMTRLTAEERDFVATQTEPVD